MYVAVVLGIGVSGNVEGLAKSVFDQSTLYKFNQLNTVWLIVYFFVLRGLQNTGLIGVFFAYLIFYYMRVAIAIYTADKMNEFIRWKEIVKAFIPAPLELATFASAAIICKGIMGFLSDKPKIGFLLCVLMAGGHFAAYCYRRRSTIKDFRQILKS